MADSIPYGSCGMQEGSYLIWFILLGLRRKSLTRDLVVGMDKVFDFVHIFLMLNQLH